MGADVLGVPPQSYFHLPGYHIPVTWWSMRLWQGEGQLDTPCDGVGFGLLTLSLAFAVSSSD